MSSTVKQDSQKQEGQATRGQHARRFARIGMLVGAVMGLGGGVAGVLKFALLGAAGGAVAGGVAGSKLAPLADKLSGFLPGRRKGKTQEAAVGASPALSQAVSPERPQVKAPLDEQFYKDIGSIDPEVLAEIREGINGAVTKLKASSIAEAGMAKEGTVAENGGWVDAVSNKRPTHPAHLTYQ